jgi:glycosyltransferase involved in cell wall biosynthesis
MLGYVPDEERALLYRGAAFFAFPSLCEGFGIPVLDAMACDCPVLASDIGSHREIAQGAAHYIDPLDIEDMTRGITKMIGDHEYREALVEKGRERVKQFTVAKHAERIQGVYRTLF